MLATPWGDDGGKTILVSTSGCAIYTVVDLVHFA